jgi:hypothetical protein
MKYLLEALEKYRQLFLKFVIHKRPNVDYTTAVRIIKYANK